MEKCTPTWVEAFFFFWVCPFSPPTWGFSRGQQNKHEAKKNIYIYKHPPKQGMVLQILLLY
jgi:hypothetical protein